MNTQEFSREFNILYDNIASQGAPGLNEYEKSVFLTRAQEDIVRKYFDYKENIKQEGEGESMERSIDFSELIIPTKAAFVDSSSIVLTDPRSILYKVEDDIFFIQNNVIRFTSNGSIFRTMGQVLSNGEYNMLMTKSYPEPPRRITWILMRKDASPNHNETHMEIIPHSKFLGIADSNIDYTIRYIKRPEPIVLVDIETDPEISGMGLSINGVNTVSECELNELLHPQILRRAVEMAKASYIGDINSFVQIHDKPA